MLDYQKVSEIIEDHFTNLTHEQFQANLREFCPYLFEEESVEVDDTLKNAEIYRQAQQENKLEIAPKLLRKGMSVDEVAELLELDIDLVRGLPSCV